MNEITNVDELNAYLNQYIQNKSEGYPEFDHFDLFEETIVSIIYSYRDVIGDLEEYESKEEIYIKNENVDEEEINEVFKINFINVDPGYKDDLKSAQQYVEEEIDQYIKYLKHQ